MGLHAVATPPAPRVAPQNRPTLLIVDDEPGPRESLRIVFKDRFDCTIATCGRDGVNYARDHHVDVAILDIKMPDLTGIEVLERLKEIDPHIECVMLTGYETVETARAAVRHGAADYLNKPFDVFLIRDVLDKCLARRQRRLATEESLVALHRINDELTAALAHAQHEAQTAGVASAGVVHEINNPLAIIAGYAQLLERDLAGLTVVDPATREQVAKRVDSIQREIQRCTQIARQFLDRVRQPARTLAVIPAAGLLEDAATLIRAHLANRSAVVSWKVADPDLQVHGNAAELLQVLINLGVNALHAMDGAGFVRLNAEPATDVPAELAFRAPAFDAARPHVAIIVTDTGHGIPAENLKKVFEPYFTTKAEGTGLGLRIVCDLIAQHHGAVNVASTVGKGTAVTLYLPAAK